MIDKPILTNEYTGKAGGKYIFEYFETDSFAHLPFDECKQCYGIAFHGNKIVIVNDSTKNTYGPVGGSVEKDENPDDTLKREIQEESNMKVLSYVPIGYQRVVDTRGIQEPYYQLRYFCIVEPYGPFVSDIAGKVTEVLEIDPSEYKKYFDWGAIGDRIMEKALRLKRFK